MAGGWLERGLHGDGRRRHSAQSLADNHRADAPRGAAEFVGRSPLIAQRDQGILCDRMIDDVDGHRGNYNRLRCPPCVERSSSR